MAEQIPRLAGLSLALLSWVAVWGLMDLMVHAWPARAKFWLYAAILLCVGIIIYREPAVLEHF